MIFSLIQDFADALNAMPREHPRYRILKLLDEAIRRDVHFIERHSTTFFQCMWNTCWWYDCPEAAGHYDFASNHDQTDFGVVHGSMGKLFQLVKHWRDEKASSGIERPWLRALRPPDIRLGAGCATVANRDATVLRTVFSADSRRLAILWNDGRLLLYDVDGNVRMELETEPWTDPPLVWHPAGERLLLGNRVLDVSSGTMLRSLDAEEFQVSTFFPFACFSQDGSLVATIAAMGSAVLVWDFETGRVVRQIVGHQRAITGLAFTPDDQAIVSISKDQSLRVTRLEDGKPLILCEAALSLTGLAIAPENGTALCLGTDQTRLSYERHVLVWSMDTWELQHSFLVPLGGMYAGESLCVDPNGSHVWVEDNSMLGVSCWNTESDSIVKDLQGHDLQLTCFSLSPNGRRLATGGNDGVVRMWDTTAMADRGRHLGSYVDVDDMPLQGSARFSLIGIAPEGQQFLTLRDYRDGSMQSTYEFWVWDVASTLPVAKHSIPEEIGARVSGAVLSGDQWSVIARDEDGSLFDWDPTHGKQPLSLRSRPCCFQSLVPSSDRRSVVEVEPVTGYGIRISVWDAQTGARVSNFEHETVAFYGAALSRDARQVVAYGESAVELLEGLGEKWKQAWKVELPHAVRGIAVFDAQDHIVLVTDVGLITLSAMDGTLVSTPAGQPFSMTAILDNSGFIGYRAAGEFRVVSGTGKTVFFALYSCPSRYAGDFVAHPKKAYWVQVQPADYNPLQALILEGALAY